MIRPWIVGLTVMGFLLGIPAHAGSVSGKIRLEHASSTGSNIAAGDRENVVIWLEGGEKTEPPKTPIKISQRNLQFSPGFIVAVKGQQVDMPNDDDVAHNVYSFTGMNQFNLGIYAKGEFRSVTFKNTGIVDLFCSIHRQMHARVFVVPTRYFASSMPGQSFTISDVPPGKYTLKAWYERSHMLERTVVVPRSGTVVQNLVLDSAPSPAASGGK